jgi:type III restriction enzyme
LPGRLATSRSLPWIKSITSGVKLRDISTAWTDYATEQGDRDAILPLLVLQVPNTPDDNEIGTWLNAIFESYPDLPPDCIANVFGEHEVEQFGRHYARYVPPERVQHDKNVRILVAKDAISTGWDCPRAEVMLSFRAATDRTHITQLLGRMVRTPLARRIPGNERLNSVDCLLPRFDQTAVEYVVKALTSAGGGEPDLPGRRVLINPREMTPNPAMPEAVWEILGSLPSQTLPKKQARPVQRLTILAHELAFDGLLADAGKKAHAEMHKMLDQARLRYENEIEAARSAVMVVEGVTVEADVATGNKTFNDFVEAADLAVIEEVFAKASRSFSREDVC